MKKRSYRYQREARGARKRGDGIFSRIGQRFGISTGMVITGFIIGWILLPILTTLVFLFALYWNRHPHDAERFVERMILRGRRLYGSLFGGPRTATAAAGSATMAAAAEPDPYSDYEFRELRRKFEDLEQRAADMESHVASDEYELNQEFKRMRDDA